MFEVCFKYFDLTFNFSKDSETVLENYKIAVHRQDEIPEFHMSISAFIHIDDAAGGHIICKQMYYCD